MMELFFGISNIGFGLILALIGFKIYNPFKGKNLPEKEQEWYKKFGTLFKLGGIGLFVWGMINTIGNL